MNRLFFTKAFTALFIFFFVSVAYAESLDEDEARYAAIQFFNPSSQSTRLRTKGLQLKLRSNGHENGYYIFDRPEGGTVFVADDDAIGRTVLGYTDEGTFDTNNLPVGLQDWLEQVEVLMDAVHEGKINRENVHAKARQIVVDGLIKTKWGQEAPFNNLCPLYNGKRCVTGCVATAMAQIMKYWRWPEHGYGSVTYTDTYGCRQTLSQDFSSSTYNWNNMPNTYSTGGYTSVQSTAVATLMRDCGYAVRMQYTPDGSGATVSPMDMANYFHYNAAAKERISQSYPEEIWHEFIIQDLLAGRPVLYSGRNIEDEGHQFIIDGYDAAGYYHVNWGWKGNKDGWFIMTNLNGYNDQQAMINELVPDYGTSNFSYSLSNNVLTISGSGIIPQEYVLDHAPWASRSSSIRKIVIGEGITDIPNYFGSGYETSYYFSNLTELVLPEGLRSIGECAFQRSALSAVLLPSTLVSMDNAFWRSNIKSLHLPKNLTCYIDDLPYLNELTIDEDNPYLSVKENVLYTKDGRSLLFAPGGLSRIDVAETTESVYDYTILRNEASVVFKGMDAPSMPEYLQNYPDFCVENSGYMFIPFSSKGYDGWKKVLPSGWTVLNYTDINHVPETTVTWALDGNTLTISGWGVQKYAEFGYNSAPYYSRRSNIQKLIVEEGVLALCWDAYYYYSNLSETVLPSTLKFIDGNCFRGAGLTSITCYAKQAPTLGNNYVLGSLPSNGTLRVPEGANYSKWLSALPSGWKIEYFTPDAFATCYLYNGEQRMVNSLSEWEKLLGQYPNTIGIINPDMEQLAYMTINMLLQDAATDRFLCPYLQLTDLTGGFNTTEKRPLTGFAPPASFDISKGTYSRQLSKGYNTCYLPFAISEEELPPNCHMFDYSHFESDKNDIIFVPKTSSEANSPFFVTSETAINWQIDLSGKAIAIQQTPETNSYVRGSFVTTDEYQNLGYSPRTKDNIFAPLALYLHPFRACILINSSDAPSEVRARLLEDDDADQLKDIMASPITPFNYTLDGKRLSHPVKGHPYIENGKIVIR